MCWQSDCNETSSCLTDLVVPRHQRRPVDVVPFQAAHSLADKLVWVGHRTANDHVTSVHAIITRSLTSSRGYLRGYWTTRGYANSRSANLRTGRLADWTSRRLVNSRTRQLAYWTSRGLDNSRMPPATACLVFVLLAASARPRVVQTASWLVRDLSSPRVDQSASWQSESWRIRELSSYHLRHQRVIYAITGSFMWTTSPQYMPPSLGHMRQPCHLCTCPPHSFTWAESWKQKCTKTLYGLAWHLSHWLPVLRRYVTLPNADQFPTFIHQDVQQKMCTSQQLECGPMPNVMVALTNIGGALCSTPQSLTDAHY